MCCQPVVFLFTATCQTERGADQNQLLPLLLDTVIALPQVNALI